MTTALKRLIATGAALVVVAGLCLSHAYAGYGGGGYGGQPAKPRAAAKQAVIEATVTGQNVCLGCALKKAAGAAAQCSVYGHRHAFRVGSAVGADGKPIAGAKKWVLSYLENDKSTDLVKGHDGETLTITGKVYPAERILEVLSYKPAPAEAAAKPHRHEGT